VRPKLAAITVTGCHLIMVICVRSELADLEQVQAERLDLGQHTVQRGTVQQPGQHGMRAVMVRGPSLRGLNHRNQVMPDHFAARQPDSIPDASVRTQ
jgi:hypothetical protein